MPRINIKFTGNDFYESLLFLILTAGLLAPVFAHNVFFTHDGPAHLYNSQIIKAFLTGEGQMYDALFKINTIPEPNWTGHALLVALLFFVKPLVAEKILVAIYIVGFCVGFRYWVKSFGNSSSWASFLVFPFVYSFPLYVGFFNFCLGLVLLFFIAGYWVRHAKGANWGKGMILFLLFAVAYFTHITTFIVAIIFVGAYTCFGLSGSVILHKEKLLSSFSKYRVSLLATLPVLLFSLIFFGYHGGGKVRDKIPSENLWQSLLEISPITVFNTSHESPFSVWVSYAIWTLCLFAAVSLLLEISKNNQDKYTWKFKGWHGLTQPGNINLLLAVGFLLLYFLLPNEMASGGFVSVRLSLLFFLTLIGWLSTMKLSQKLVIPIVVIALVATSHLLEYRDGWAKMQNKFVAGLLDVAPHIPEGKVVMPLIESEEWIFLHASNYLGAIRPVVVLDNYEAETGYFPLLWKPVPSPGVYFGEPIFRVCGEQFKKMESSVCKADIILHYNDGIAMPREDCAVSMYQIIDTDYEPYYFSQDGKWRLLRKRNLN